MSCLLGSGFKKVGLSVHEFGTELGHLVFHLSHFSVETLADVAEFGIDHAEIAQFDRDVSLDAAVICHLCRKIFDGEKRRVNRILTEGICDRQQNNNG